MKFYYFGDDEAFFRALQGEFRKHTRLVFDFKRFTESKEAQIQSFFLKVFQEHPSVVFIDFSKNTQDYLHLARILSRTKMEHQVVLVGLVDYLSPPEVLTESIATGVSFSYIKSAEIFDVVYDVTRLIAPNECATHGFATATLGDEWEVGIPCKVGYVHPAGLHVETDLKLGTGDKMRINHAWTEKRMVPSRDVFVKEIQSSNLFYQYRFSADLDFMFVDEFLPPEGMEEQKIIEKKQEREDALQYHKKQLKKWIDDNQERSVEKKAKLLVVDRNFHFYQNQPRTDKNAYTIRCIPDFSDVGEELMKHTPQIIAIQLDKEGEGGNSTGKNTLASLEKLAEVLKAKFADLKCFIVAFNAPLDSAAMQARIRYPQVMAHDGELSVDVVMKMADLVQKRLNVTKLSTFPGKRVFINKTQPSSIVEFVKSIKVTKLSESDLIFQTDFELTPGQNLHVRQPVDMYISVQPLKAQGKVPEYFGLIHSIGEKQKKELRKFVNSVFFRDNDAAKQAEVEEYKKLNDQKQQEKTQDAEKKAQGEESGKDGSNMPKAGGE